LLLLMLLMLLLAVTLHVKPLLQQLQSLGHRGVAVGGALQQH
jgi:hypothetical protein